MRSSLPDTSPIQQISCRTHGRTRLIRCPTEMNEISIHNWNNAMFVYTVLCFPFFPLFPHWPKGLPVIIELEFPSLKSVLSSTPHPHGKKLHDKALCLASSIKLSWRQHASTLMSLFWVPLSLSDPLCEVQVGENWKRMASTKPSLVANSGW